MPRLVLGGDAHFRCDAVKTDVDFFVRGIFPNVVCWMSYLTWRTRHEDVSPRLHCFTRGLLQRSFRRVAEVHNWHSATSAECSSSSRHKRSQVRPWLVECRVYFMTSYTGSTFLNESSTSSLSWSAGVWRTKLQSTWTTTALRSLPSAADIHDQLTSISWLYRHVAGLHSAVGFSLLRARRSGTHCRPNFVPCLTVLMTLGARKRRYCLRDISAFSAIEMHLHNIALYKFSILLYSIL